jgi:penicillin-binding protein 2
MERSSSRLKVFAILVAIMFAALSTRLWFLQVLATEVYAQEAQNNSVRTAKTDALRGEIWTSDQYAKEEAGSSSATPLVTNRKSLEVRVNKQELIESGRAERVLLRLSEMLDIPVEEINDKLADKQYFDYQPKPIAEFVDEEVRFYIEEHADQFPGVDVVDASVRAYPMGTMAAHTLGWVGQIDADQVEEDAYRNYGNSDLVGKTGVELTYEKWLRGRKGVQRYVVNSDGETIRNLGEVDPTPGDNLVLTLDSNVQKSAEVALQEGMERARTIFDDDPDFNKYFEANAGAVVVLDAKTGGVVAMASNPSYDPRWFVRGLKPQEYRYLFKSPRAPALDRAFQQDYIPGSTFKPFTALAAVKEGVADLGSYYGCPAEYVHPGDASETTFHNWSTVDLAARPLNELLKISCDTSFYAWGSEFYNRYVQNQFGENNEPLQRDLRQWGFQHPTGLDLPGEVEGLIPDAAWGNAPEQKGTEQEPGILPFGWVPGGDILLMIGSGYATVTPLQLAQAYATLANEGKICQPHVVDRIVDDTGETVKKVSGHCGERTVPYTQDQLDYILDALTNVPKLGGTAYSAFQGFPLEQYPIAGKTGTAFRGYPFQDTSWFAGVVPANDPQYVVVAMVEQAGFGSDVAAPIVRKVIEGIYGIESGAPAVVTAGQD